MRCFIFELKKLFIKQRLLMMILILLLAKSLFFLYDVNTYKKEYKVNNGYLNSYLLKWGGKLTENKADEIEAERERLNNIISELENQIDSYENEGITETGYVQAVSDYKRAELQKIDFDIVSASLYDAKSNPDKVFIMDTTGFDKITDQQYPDFLLILFVLLLSCLVFSFEYGCGIVPILLTTKYGGISFAFKKIIIVLMTTIIISAIFSAVEYNLVSVQLGLENGDYPMQSIALFRTSTKSLSLNGAFLLAATIKTIGLIFFSFLVVFIYLLCKKTVTALFLGLSVVVLPLYLFHTAELRSLVPSPLALLMPYSYFMGNIYELDQLIFKEISWKHFFIVLTVLVFLTLFSFFASVMIYKKYHFKKKYAVKLFTLVILSVIFFSSCNNEKETNKESEIIYNSCQNNSFFDAGDYFISLMSQDTEIIDDSGKRTAVFRDAFDYAFEKTDSKRYFYNNNKLYYLSMSSNKIIELNLKNYKEKTFYSFREAKLSQSGDKKFFGIEALKPKANTTVKKAFGNDKAFTSSFCIYNQKLLYLSDFKIYLVNKKKQKQLLLDEKVRLFSTNGDLIYFVNEKSELYQFDFSSNNVLKITENKTDYINWSGDYIYYKNNSDNGYLYRINRSTMVSEKIAEINFVQMIIQNQYIFYTEKDMSFNRLNINTAEIVKVSDMQFNYFGIFSKKKEAYAYIQKDENYEIIPINLNFDKGTE